VNQMTYFKATRLFQQNKPILPFFCNAANVSST
jgi:hypothetical protein